MRALAAGLATIALVLVDAPIALSLAVGLIAVTLAALGIRQDIRESAEHRAERHTRRVA